MLSVASLLNPVPPEPRGTRLPSSPLSSVCTTPSSFGSPLLSTQPSTKKQKMNKDGAIFTKGSIKGEVNYPPFELLDAETKSEVHKFRVYPLGNIQEYPRHIPYNSEKKSFLEKTGRESFEVFQYVFRLPNDNKDYIVMWDYNIGLVRITPFFKCFNYPKTAPAKMLSMNPGLKEITHSITGGALAAQGYWMPYSCALAVCTTFCSPFSGALIPIFGPDFPAQCVPPEAPEYKRWAINPEIIAKATVEAEAYRVQYSSFAPKSSRDSCSPQQSIERVPESLCMRSTPHPGKRLRLKRTFGGDSPYGTNTDTDMNTGGSETSSGDGYFFSPVTSASAISTTYPQIREHQNQFSHSANSSINIPSYKDITGPNPWLSAIPRSTGMGDLNMGSCWSAKRRVDEMDADDEYEGEESASVTDDKCSGDEKGSDREMEDAYGGAGGAEKNAAWLLMKLSVKDSESSGMDNGPRVKRRRATSL